MMARRGAGNKTVDAGKKRSPRTFGPLTDLERHLPPDWWRTLFNAVYLKTDGDVVESRQNTAKDVDLLLETVPLTPDSAILDLCCGQGRHSIELARRGFTSIVGIDRSRYLVRLAKRRASKAGLNITFREADARKFRLPESSLDCVTLFGNSFGYFERAEDDLAVLQAVGRVLKPGGAVVLDVVDGDWMRSNYAPRSWEWIDQNHFVCRERALAADGRRLISREVVTHAERGVIADQLYAERLYSCAELTDLLKRAGFVDIEFHDAPRTESERGHDLGMMALRLFAVARLPREVRPPRRVGVLFPEVTVLLGDPSLPDMVKREGRFNQEDVETIERMKQALGELEDYSFRYWDDHEHLLRFLADERPGFVFNLCDEGYRNDAFKELHVPSLLDMFEIPYTGAGPVSLGLCYDKALVRALAQSLDIPVPLESYFSPDDHAATLPSTFPALLKPNQGDSSLGITKDAVVENKEELIEYWEQLRGSLPKRSLLVQEFLSGPEYSVGVIGNPGLQVTVLPILEVDYRGLTPGLPRILGYESKWLPDSPYWTQIAYRQAQIGEKAARNLADHSLALFERLACRDYARFDFRTDAQGEIKLLEVNPNPGWCWDGKFNIMAGFGGLSYADMLRLILETAQERIAGERNGP